MLSSTILEVIFAALYLTILLTAAFSEQRHSWKVLSRLKEHERTTTDFKNVRPLLAAELEVRHLPKQAQLNIRSHVLSAPFAATCRNINWNDGYYLAPLGNFYSCAVRRNAPGKTPATHQLKEMQLWISKK